MFSRYFEHEQVQEPNNYDHLPRVKLNKKNIVPRDGFFRKKLSAKKIVHSDEEQTFIYCQYGGCEFRTRIMEKNRIQAKRRFKLHLKLKHCERRKTLGTQSEKK